MSSGLSAQSVYLEVCTVLLRSMPIRQRYVHCIDLLLTCRKPRKQSAESAFLSVIAAFAIFAALAGLLALLLCELPFP